MMPQLNRQDLFGSIKEILVTARETAYRAINTAMVQAYWEVGRLIVEDEQQGKHRADYGKAIISELSSKLTIELGPGFSAQSLRNMRQFYLLFPNLSTVWSNSNSIRSTVWSKLTWSHIKVLLRVEKPEAREYYLKEAVAANWSVRTLERQVHAFYYERILSSRDKGKTRRPETDKSSSIALNPSEFIKDPFILEFLKMSHETRIQEQELETAIISHLQEFLLELGTGFSFVARQKHIRTETSDFFIDLVFYHIKLRCFILIDLKIGKLTHQDIGQMDMYVRMFNDLQRGDEDNPSIGIILCSEKDETIVKYSVLAENKRLFASKYMLYMPTEEQLKAFIEHDRYLFDHNQGE